MSFWKMIERRWEKGFSVCVGLDSDYELFPHHLKAGSLTRAITTFNNAIVDATKDVISAYKPNIAFYAKYGEEGLEALQQTIDYARTVALDVPVILDFNRGGVGNAAIAYAEEAYSNYGYNPDAVTLNPYSGFDSVAPFLQHQDKGAIILCRTSNPGAGQMQDCFVQVSDDELLEFFPHGHEEAFSTCGWKKLDMCSTLMPYYQRVALRVSSQWNENSNCGLVVGATAPDQLRMVRYLIGDMPILVPGIGKQGGDLKAVLAAGLNSKKQGLIINSSSGIIFASKGEDFADVAREKVLEINRQISDIRNSL